MEELFSDVIEVKEIAKSDFQNSNFKSIMN